MKEKIIIFIIGLLVGSVLTTGCFFVYTKTQTNNFDNNGAMQMRGGMNPPEKPDGENSNPPEMPNNQNNELQESSNDTENN